MNTEQKKQYVLNTIGENSDEFYRQAEIKIAKHRHLLQTDTDYIELVSDVVWSVCKNLNDDVYLDKYYTMATNNKLHLYILKAINTNCNSFQAPFLKRKLKDKGTIYLDRDIESDHQSPMDSDTLKFFNMPEEKQDIVKSIYKMMSEEEAPQIFGPHWKYFVQLLHDYIDNPKASYRSIAKEYGVTFGSIYNHLKIAKEKIINKLNDENTKHY